MFLVFLLTSQSGCTPGGTSGDPSGGDPVGIEDYGIQPQCEPHGTRLDCDGNDTYEWTFVKEAGRDDPRDRDDLYTCVTGYL